MTRFTILAVAAAALSTAAVAQVGTHPVENKVDADQLPTTAGPPATSVTDDAPPSSRPDVLAATPDNVTQAASESVKASGPPPRL